VAMFVRDAGDHWAPSLRELHKELVVRGNAQTTPDGRDGGQWRVGLERKKKRGWLMPISVFGLQAASSGLQSETTNGGSAEEHNQLESQGNEEEDTFLPPLPPSPEEEEAFPSWQDNRE